MKKRIRRIVFLLIVCFIIILVVSVCKSSYKLNYKINEYYVNNTYKNGRYYFEVHDDKYKYNFDFYDSKKFVKIKIKDIKKIEGEDFHCIVPIIKNIDTYPLCYKNDEYIDYNLIENELLNGYKNQDYKTSSEVFEYFNNSNKKVMIALYNYNGFYLMYEDEVKEIDLFETDQYDNSLSVLIKNKILLPNYDQKHEFNEFILLNLETSKVKKIKTKYDIDYDSYIAGINKNNVYLYDNKYEKLYRINIRTNKVVLLSNLVKIEDQKEIPALKKEYKNKITFFNKKTTFYTYEESENVLYKMINDNKELKEIIFVGKTQIIKEDKNDIYFVSDDNLYVYNSEYGVKTIFHYFELNFLEASKYIFVFNN